MDKKIKQKLLIVLACILAVAATLTGIYMPDDNINNQIAAAQNIVQQQIAEAQAQANDEVIITEEIKQSAEEVKSITEKEKIETIEVLESSKKEENEIMDEGALEIDGTVFQENISYDGTNTGKGTSLLGACQGLTYYSQADSRWANQLYTSCGNRSQTMKSSACGPTSAAMVTSSSKGVILPTTMAQLSVANGYRTRDNGTAWSYFSFVADYFDFNEFYQISSYSSAMNYLTQKRADGSQKYYAVVCCGSGLWTTGGHYIVVAGVDGDTVKVYDPYLYSGKFNTASRRPANVRVEGNAAYVSKANFQKYSSINGFFIYSNDSALKDQPQPSSNNYTQGQRILVDDKVAVAYDGGADKVLVDNGMSQYWIHRSVLTKDSRVYGLGIVCWPEGDRVLVQIFDTQFWTKTSNITSNIPSAEPAKASAQPAAAASYKLGNYKTTSNLNVRAGAGTGYKVKKTYSKGTVFTALEIKGDWARTPSGWVNLKYVKKI